MLVVVGSGRVGAGLAEAGELVAVVDGVLALTTRQAELTLRRLLASQPGGSHTPTG